MIKYLLKFYQNRFLSRWTVLFFDVAWTFIAIILAIAFRFNFNVDQAQRLLSVYSLSAASFIYLATFLLVASHKGILRHTSLDDVRNLFKAIMFGGVFSLIVPGYISKNSEFEALDK